MAATETTRERCAPPAPARAWQGRMEGCLERVEHGQAVLSERLARVEATLPHLATKEDVAQLRADVQAAVNGLTWRLFLGLGALRAFLAALMAALRWLGG